MNYVARIRYVGSDFCGFQAQPGRRTVQGELTRAVSEAFGVPCSITGCSRTDSGVHAEDFCLLITPGEGAPLIPPDRLPRAMAEHLPPDISLFHACEAPEGFHPRYGTREKEYCYRILCTPVADPFYYKRVWHCPGPWLEGAVGRMNAAGAHLVGEHDFAAFMAEGSPVTSTVRHIYSCQAARVGDLLEIRVRGNGFLYNMVRIIVGTLVAVAKGKLEPGDIPEIIASCDRTRAGMTAPPDGLYLSSVVYPDGALPQME